jgi:hypothetical protein
MLPMETARASSLLLVNELKLEHAGSVRFSQFLGLRTDRNYSIEYKSTG